MRREKKTRDPLGLHEKVVARRKEMKEVRNQVEVYQAKLAKKAHEWGVTKE